MTQVFENLREKLDVYSVGFPATESGVELKLLKKLFTEEDAKLFLDLSLSLENSDSIAEKTGRNVQETENHLDKLAKKGLIFKQKTDSQVLYGAFPFVAGWYEYPLFNADKELAGLVEAYFEEGFLSDQAKNSILPKRSEPVRENDENALRIAPYMDAVDIIKSKEIIALADCVCRSHKKILEENCDKPIETCFVFDSHAEFYVENGMGRFISQDEALEILDKCDYAGLVHQTGNTVNPGGMCNCCGDCCRILRMLKKSENPSKLVLNKYHLKIDQEECISCETCKDQCQMDAIKPGPDGLATVDQNRCIGCGQCAYFCPAKAVTMELKSEGDLQIPSQNDTSITDEIESYRGMNHFHSSIFVKSV